jgi:hypothetical protein
MQHHHEEGNVMAGLLPQNRGNKSATRIGPVVARRLKKAGINVSSAARKGRSQGIFVSARGDRISVLIDLDRPEPIISEQASEIAAVVTSWGLTPEISVRKVESGFIGNVRFTHPLPAPKDSAPRPASKAAADDTEWGRIQKSTVHSALLAAGLWTDEGYTTEQESTTLVRISFSDASPERDELVGKAEAALIKKKYNVQHEDGSLIVRKAKKPKKLSPQERMAQAAAAVEAAPATPKPPAEDLGKPVYHKVTKELVGYLSKKRFISIEEVPE